MASPVSSPWSQTPSQQKPQCSGPQHTLAIFQKTKEVGEEILELWEGVGPSCGHQLGKEVALTLPFGKLPR